MELKTEARPSQHTQLAWLIGEALRCGTIASLVMMPAGFLFKALDLRVGHYGPKLGALLFGDPTPAVLFMQHMVIGWVSALPLVLALVVVQGLRRRIWLGTLYGLAYYLLVNSLILPLAFGDPLPWQLGLAFIVPSLVVHLIYGASIGFTFGRSWGPRARGKA